MAATPAFQFFSSEADDAKWLIWGRILWRKGTRGTRYPDPYVRVQITDTAIKVSRELQTFYYGGNVAAPCQCRGLSIVRTPIPAITTSYTQVVSLGTLVLLSDGTQLASIPYTDGAGTKTNYPQVTTWSGDGWIQLFDTTDNGANWTAGDRVTFEVPADVCRPALPDTPPTYPGSLAVASSSVILEQSYTGGNPSFLIYDIAQSTVSFGSTVLVGTQRRDNIGGGSGPIQYTMANYPVYYLGEVRVLNGEWLDTLGTANPQDNVPYSTTAWVAEVGELAAALAQWGVDWTAARAVATVRERARLKTCSDSVKTNLKNGVLQDQVKKVLRSGHPVSSNTSQKALMTATVTNSTTGSGDDITNTKVVTLSYVGKDTNGDPITIQQIVTGTQHIVITRCANSSGTPNVVNYTTTTYTNWLPITTSSGGTGTALDYTFQLDSRQGLAQRWNGVVVTGAASIALTFDSLGGTYTPPYLQSSDSRTFSYPQVYIDYRAATARVYTPVPGGGGGGE